jgi:hypothetical protein
VTPGLDLELAALKQLSRVALTNRWHTLFRTAPPVAFTPDLLARGIAWHLQEKALGSLSSEARRTLAAPEQDVQRRHRSVVRLSLRPGNRLIRRWRGRTYVVEVTPGGLIHEGERFASLSVIARKITGTRWSGPKFFGLVP